VKLAMALRRLLFDYFSGFWLYFWEQVDYFDFGSTARMMGKKVLQRQVGGKDYKRQIVSVQQLYDGGDMYITTSRRGGKIQERRDEVHLDVFKIDADLRYQTFLIPSIVPDPRVSCAYSDEFDNIA
jgi:hypothetical protein